ncbi:hypothetical protein RKD23_003927 [Streptomyces sp. SAI-170]|uniref:hypothetical protein n=1 Tax=Streptomyces sp. SAI-170 TaxID=3377729 RepID=UPI003C7A5506
MGISSRRALTSAATALLLGLTTAHTAAAEEVPSESTAADQTTDINDRQGWEDAEEQPLTDVVPLVCDSPETWYTITSKKATHIPSWWNGTSYKDGPGGTMSVSVTKSGTGHTYTHDIGRNKYGHLQYGASGYVTTWKKWRSSGGHSCNTVEIGHGKATFPTSETGWKYWETSA